MRSYATFLLVLLLPFEIHSHSIRKNGKVSPKVDLPIIVAHRGDKVQMPEHTIPAYEFAMAEGVDFVEPDLVLTNDSVLVCYHDLTIGSGTNVRDIKEFEHLRFDERNITIDGVVKTIKDDWLISDFTLAQLQTIKVIQKATGIRPKYFDKMFSIPTFDEFIEAVHKFTLKTESTDGKEKVVGIMPELKHPSYHNALRESPFYMEETFIRKLESYGYSVNDADASHCEYNTTIIPCSPVVVQSFEPKTIEYLHNTTALRLLALFETTPHNLRYLTYKGLAEMKGKMEFVSVWKELLFTGTLAEIEYNKLDYDEEEIEQLGGFIEPEKFVEFAEELGMKVGIYTIYSSWEDSKRGCSKSCTNETKTVELEYYFRIGVKAFFVEGVCESLRIRDGYFAREGGSSSGVRMGEINKLHLALIFFIIKIFL
ncbi:Glycerophosphodiester phosphodiesterase GDPD6 [Orchesella cincta]|uniref:glycerophosphodiester phosphodiesterase n=1 Tax=Orchesella cincta TaxID=48709 RepID=A0A1D2M7Z2_ORCCI|nr:Glycerophosphodiester phosphodiesterase GDPD6 [Orchesella cincta]